jgi:ABC-2 type transport system permease protein
MAISDITFWELKQIFKGKKFTYAFIIQFFAILAIIPLFDVYSEILEDPTEIILPTSKGYLPVALAESPLQETIMNQPVFRVYTVTEQQGFALLETHIVCCFISGETLHFDKTNPKARVAEFHLQRLLQKEPAIKTSFTYNEKSVVPLQQLRARELAMREIRRTAEMMQSEQINYSTLLILLLAIFLASGILVDLIVSEREKQTGEILMSLPVEPWKVIISKVSAVVFVLLFQIVLWISTLYILGRVSTLLSMVPLFLAAFLIISLTCLASVYAKSYKEAGFAITVAYVLLFAFLMSASAFYALSDRFSFLSPLSMVIAIEKGEITLSGVGYAALPTFLLSCTLLFVSVKIYERDEFYFGPRPSFFRLITLFSVKTVFISFLFVILVFIAVYAALSAPLARLLLVLCGVIL